MCTGGIRIWAAALGVLWLGTGCGTGPTTAPSGAPTASGSTGGGAQEASISVFRPDRSTITDGENVTLSWAAAGGTVSLAIKGQSPFAVGLGTTGSHVLSPGAAGYPPGFGETTYEAVVGEAAARAETTVNLLPQPTPTPTQAPPPTIDLSGATTCYPIKAGGAGCDVPVTATATNYTSISWGGCCSGSGSTSICHVPDLAAYDCTATATGEGGSGSGKHTVSGTNEAPRIKANVGKEPNPQDCGQLVWFTFHIDDEEGVAACPTVEAAPGQAAIQTVKCPTDHPLEVMVRLRTWFPPHPAGQNSVELVVRDPWREESTLRSASVQVNACP